MEKSIQQAVEDYLYTVQRARSQSTTRTYANGLHAFTTTLNRKASPTKISKKSGESQTPLWTETTPIGQLSDDAIAWFIVKLKSLAPSSEQLYLTAVVGFYKYLAAERLAAPNLTRIQLLVKQRSRRPGKRLPQFPRRSIEDVTEYAINLAGISVDDPRERSILLRDRALLLTLADTGLRIHEACNLRRGDIDWDEGKAVVIGKGDRQAVVRFSSRSLAAIKDYLAARAGQDGASGRPLPSLPVFAGHSDRSGKRLSAISTRTGWNIVHQRVIEALGEETAQTITPHSFRHYFVTTVLRGSGGNLKLAQELARHKNISVTENYAHLSDDELDKGYFEIFDQKE